MTSAGTACRARSTARPAPSKSRSLISCADGPAMSIFDADDNDLEELAERLTDSDPKARRVVVMQLADTGDTGAVPLVVQALKDEDAGVREAAARALDGFDGPDVVGPLLDALEDSEPSVRAIAAEVLAAKQDPDDAV